MAELTQGTIVNNRYSLLEYKGRGSFGEVWLAHDDVLGIDVALKIYISLDQRGVEEFKSEYTNTLGLSHPSLLTASFFDVWDHRPFLVMKYCERGSSNCLVGHATELEVWQFIHDVADGLAYLHDQPDPIIHQDIKPDNILVNTDSRFLITDFGISKRVRSTMRKQSKRAVGAGATAYMGPERFGEDSSPVKASDVWSLGVSAYELATGELPFSGMGGGMQRNGAERPNLPQGWSPNLNDLIRRMMDKETWDRPTAQQIADYTREVLDGNDISFEVWKNGPVRDVKKKSTKKMLIGIACGVVGILAVAAIIFSLLGNKVEVRDEDTDIQDHYSQLLALCRNNVKIGNAQNVASLIEAREQLDSLEYYWDEYPSISEKLMDSDPQDIADELDAKLAEASAAWERSGESQLNIAEDIPAAIEHFQIAARLKDSPAINDRLKKIAEISGCKGAIMLVRSVSLDGDKLIIRYDNLAGTPINGMPLYYFLSDGVHKLDGKDISVNLESGRDNTLTVTRTEYLEYTPTEITLSNASIQFYKGPVRN